MFADAQLLCQNVNKQTIKPIGKVDSQLHSFGPFIYLWMFKFDVFASNDIGMT